MSSCLTLAQMRARSSANDSSPTPWQGLCRETALAALRPCRHRTGLGLRRLVLKVLIKQGTLKLLLTLDFLYPPSP